MVVNMAMDSSVVTLAEAMGLIVDRACLPEKVVGQACLISKSRVVTCASSIFNYADAPWALSVKFPHADLIFGAKAIHLHPDFDKRQARMHYLAQTGSPSDSPLVLDGDLATITVDPEQLELPPEKISEINNALSLALNVSSQDVSGGLRANELPGVLQNALASGREGLLTILDTRNYPIARLAMRQGFIIRAIYKSLVGEMAMFELLYRKPEGSFVFQSAANFTWPNVPDIATPPDRLVPEGMRRANELPALLNQFGGPQARFRAAGEINPASFNPSIQWVVERLANILDGFITADKLWERVGADTYTIVRALQEMLNQQAVTVLPGSPFPASGSVNTILTPASDLDIKAWDQLSGLYLDPLSARPIIQQGNFFGIARILEPKSVLHTIAFGNQAAGAIVLKGNQLVGVHSGPFLASSDQTQPPVRLFQMTWIGALQDMGTKKLRTSSTIMDRSVLESYEAEQDQPVISQFGQAQSGGSGRLGRFICPNCQAINVADGYCTKCGADLDTGDMPDAPPAKGLRGLKDQVMVGKRPIIIAAAALILLAAVAMMMMGGRQSAPVDTTPQAVPGAVPTGPSQPAKTAAQYAGFKETAPEGFQYIDTSADTKNSPSFGLYSERQNQKALFIVWDNTAPVDNLNLITSKVPYSDIALPVNMTGFQVAAGQSVVGKENKFNWMVGRYILPSGKPQMALVGAFRSPVLEGKAIVVVARPFGAETEQFDHNGTLWLVDAMLAHHATASGARNTATEAEPTPPAATASEEELVAYRVKLESAIKAKFQPPEDAAATKTTVLFGIDSAGKVTKVEIKEPSGTESIDKAVVNAITAAQPYPTPPQTGAVSSLVTRDGATLKVTAP